MCRRFHFGNTTDFRAHTEHHVCAAQTHNLLGIMRCLTHMIKREVDISPVFSLHHMLESDQVVMSCKSLQVHDLPKRALSIGRVPEGIEALLQGQHLASALFDGLPDDAICLRETQQSSLIKMATTVQTLDD